MSKNTIRILLADDSADDAEALSNTLRRAGYMLKTQRIEDSIALEAALSSTAWDVLLCKHELPRLKALDALAAIGKHNSGCALLLVAKRITAEEIHPLMSAGVRDIFIQGDWSRLGPAIEREIETSRERAAHAADAETLRQLENRYRVMVENSQEAVAYCHDGVYVDANPVYLAMVGCTAIDELRTIPVLNLIDKKDHVRFKGWLRKPGTYEGAQEFLALASNGREFSAEISLTPINLGGEECVQIFIRDVSQRKALENKLRYLHQRDALTGIYSRHYLLQELAKVIEHAANNNLPVLLVGVEIHGLKGLNQKIGHAACDRLLMSITRCLREHVDKRHVLARTGGGQFALLLDGQDEKENMRVIENIRQNIAGMRFKENGNEIPLNISLSHAPVDKNTLDREKLLNSVFATVAPKEATPHAHKEALAVRPKVEKSPENNAAIAGETQAPQPADDISRLISSALTNNALKLSFQPIINLHGEPREFFEVCPAMQTVSGEMLSADAFMPSAVNSGLAGKIDRWLMQQTIEHLVQHKMEKRETAFFVSLSDTVLTDKMLLQAVQQHLKTTGADAGRIFIQLPCSAVKKQNAAARAFIEEVRKIGLNIVIDGMDNRAIGINELKGIDVAFFVIDCHRLAGAAGDNVDEAVLRGAVAMAKDLKTPTIAKGVASADIFSVLWGIGIDYIQGDYLSPALASPDHNFSEEQTLSSDAASPAFNRQAAG